MTVALDAAPAGLVLSLAVLFNSRTGLLARKRMLGLKRAAVWRELGFANLVLARAALAAKRARAKARAFSPYADAREFMKKP